MQADGGEPDQELSEQRPCPAPRATPPLNSCCSPGDHPSLSREGQRPSSSQLGLCLYFKEHKTACNSTNTAFPPALRSPAWMPQIPEDLPPFRPVHRSPYFHKRRWVTVDWRVSNRDSNTPEIQLNSWWVSLVQPLKVTGSMDLLGLKEIFQVLSQLPDFINVCGERRGCCLPV